MEAKKMKSRFSSKSILSGERINEGEDILYFIGVGAAKETEVNPERLELLSKLTSLGDASVKEFMNANKIHCIEKDGKIIGYFEGNGEYNMPYNYSIHLNEVLSGNRGSEEDIKRVSEKYGFDKEYNL